MHEKTLNEILFLTANKRFWNQHSTILEVLLPDGDAAEKEDPEEENDQVF